MIHDVDETLRKLLVEELARIPGDPVRHPDQIGFDPPSVAEAIQDRAARVNLYLHDVRENRDLRDEGFVSVPGPPDRSAVGRRQTGVRLDLSYLITAYAGDDAAVEHRLLSDILIVLLRTLSAPTKYLSGELEGLGSNAVLLTVAQPDHIANSDPASLWQALGGTLRPAVSLVVTTPFDPFATVWARAVKEAILGVGQGLPPDGPRRPLGMTGVWVSAAGVALNQETERPLEGVRVTVSGRRESVHTDSHGFFHLLNLPAGPYTLQFEKKGYQAQSLAVYAPQLGRPDQLEPTVAALRALSPEERAAQAAGQAAARATSAVIERDRTYRVSLTGTLTFADGRPAANIPVRVGRHTTTTDLSGVYYFLDLPPGDHTVYADVPGQGPLKAVPGEATPILSGPPAGRSRS